MKLSKIKYAELNGKQKEIFNFQKLAGHLAEYGFNCIKLADDWKGADFLAYHKDENDTLKIQLKSRMTIAQKYIGHELFLSFPIKGNWYLIEHDKLVNFLTDNTQYLLTKSWLKKGEYHSSTPNTTTMKWLEKHIL